MTYAALIYLIIGVLVLWRDTYFVVREEDPPPQIDSEVREMRRLLGAAPEITGPVFLVTTMFFWGPIILYVCFAWMMGWEDE